MNLISFSLTTIAGLASLLGFIILFINKDTNKVISGSLGLAIGVMVTVSLIDLMPNALKYYGLSFYSIFGYVFWILFFIIGFLISITFNDYLSNKYDELYKVGIISLITLVFHNIPEGIITYLTTTLELKSGILLTLSIALHNIPEGISIAVPIYYATNSKKKAFLLVFIAALSEPLGAIIAHLFLEDSLSNMLIAILYSLTAGIMVAISVTELIPEAKKYSIKYMLLFIVIGIIAILISHLLL